MDAIVESLSFYRYLGEIYFKELIFLAILPFAFEERFVNLGSWKIFEEESVKHLRGILQVHEFIGSESSLGYTVPENCEEQKRD